MNSGDDFTVTVNRLTSAVREQDFTLASVLVLEFREQFDQRLRVLHNDRPAAERLTTQSLELVSSAVQVCSIHRQMMLEQVSRLSASTNYAGPEGDASQTWQVDL